MSLVSPPDFLLSALRSINSNKTASESDGLFVTLTFAQSLDAKIAGIGGKQLILSGKESMIMTHWYSPPLENTTYHLTLV
jgi:2,5-diamino-6-(ribosylamino)-4(3H)-pyrimidinone 5'-phosphate reductase